MRKSSRPRTLHHVNDMDASETRSATSADSRTSKDRDLTVGLVRASGGVVRVAVRGVSTSVPFHHEARGKGQECRDYDRSD